ncbi:MAG: hypothetical protein ACSLFQ_21175 [Thermoanaerobaculia bacterium]
MKIKRIVAVLIVSLLPVVAGAASWIVVPHMGGTLAIHPERVGTVWYSAKGEPASATLRIIYDGNAQGKVLTGSEATVAWQTMQADAELLSRFLWVPHMEGTLGIPHRSVQALFFAPAEAAKPAKLRIIHDVDTKVIEGAEAEALWKKLSAK